MLRSIPPILLTSLLLFAVVPAQALDLDEAAPADLAALLDGSLAAAARYESVAAALTSAPFADRLARAATMDAAAAAPEPAAVSFDEAMADLYASAGLAMPEPFEAPPVEVAQAVAPIVAAAALSARLTDEAFAALSPEEKEFVLAHVDALAAPSQHVDAQLVDQVAALAARVDAAKIAQGSIALTSAMDRFVAPPGIHTTWTDPNGIVEIGSTSNDAYWTERVLIVDLGGNDNYQNAPATATPWSFIPLPVSVILDVGGNDQYFTGALHPSSTTSTWGQAVGIAGVGIIVDRWGDDVYYTSLYNASVDCGWDFYTGSRQVVYAQAVGLLGVGAISDLSGNDYYYAINYNDVFNYCHFAWVYTYAQAAGLTGGVGLIADDTGDDVRYAWSYSRGKADNIAATFAQAVAVGGIAVLADKEGSDYYYAGAQGILTFNYVKGAFAYVFAQGSEAATRILPAVTTVLGSAPAGDLSLCRLLGGSQGGEGESTCDAPGIAVLVDVLGDDTFDIAPYVDDYGVGCWNGGWALGSGQGSAAWMGIAALINVDVEGSDNFNVHPYANALGCGYPGVLSHAYGQGYGGPIAWNFWDAPANVPGALAVGALASLGVPQSDCAVWTSLNAKTCDVAATLGGWPSLTNSPDSYQLTANAISGAAQYEYHGAQDAYVAGQGAGKNRASALYYTFTGTGIGAHVDTGGNDAFVAIADAKGVKPQTGVLAQGAAQGFVGTTTATGGPAIGALANVGGVDKYDAYAFENGASMPAKTLVQGYADGTPIVTTPFICVGSFLAGGPCGSITLGSALGVFAEVFGYDSFSEAPERAGCMGNGSVLGGWPLGSLLIGPFWWGHVVSAPCASPTIDTGSGTAIGVDWASDVNA